MAEMADDIENLKTQIQANLNSADGLSGRNQVIPSGDNLYVAASNPNLVKEVNEKGDKLGITLQKLDGSLKLRQNDRPLVYTIYAYKIITSEYADKNDLSCTTILLTFLANVDLLRHVNIERPAQIAAPETQEGMGAPTAGSPSLARRRRPRRPAAVRASSRRRRTTDPWKRVFGI